MKNRTVTLNQGAVALLDEMAKAEGVSRREYLRALLHYAGSCYKRPGSWEAARPFDFAAYDDRTEDGRYADRWF
ncbi:MAG: ribbon-helix-helix domain-containing protein [Burkholderiales bacterium]